MTPLWACPGQKGRGLSQGFPLDPPAPFLSTGSGKGSSVSGSARPTDPHPQTLKKPTSRGKVTGHRNEGPPAPLQRCKMYEHESAARQGRATPSELGVLSVGGGGMAARERKPSLFPAGTATPSPAGLPTFHLGLYPAAVSTKLFDESNQDT